ncbi:hypothetical protein IFM89_028677, partial [Coptis chinensis]
TLSNPGVNWVMQVLSYLDSKRKVHKDAIRFCENILRRKSLDWDPLLRNNLVQPIRDVEMVITVGGDGTLLQASHFMDDSIPVLGVNSDPTVAEEVEELSNEFDATRSTGYLCAATVGNFEQVSRPEYLTKTKGNGSPLVNCRSSGLRVSTAAGSTAAMQSAGGFPTHIGSHDLQYLVREHILHGATNSSLMHGLIKSDESMHATWDSQEGVIYIDGSHVFHSIQNGDSIEVSSNGPVLKVFLPTTCQPVNDWHTENLKLYKKLLRTDYLKIIFSTSSFPNVRSVDSREKLSSKDFILFCRILWEHCSCFFMLYHVPKTFSSNKKETN